MQEMTTSEAARRLCVSPATLRRWVREGRVVPSRHTPGGQARFLLSDLPQIGGIPPLPDNKPGIIAKVASHLFLPSLVTMQLCIVAILILLFGPYLISLTNATLYYLGLRYDSTPVYDFVNIVRLSILLVIGFTFLRIIYQVFKVAFFPAKEGDLYTLPGLHHHRHAQKISWLMQDLKKR